MIRIKALNADSATSGDDSDDSSRESNRQITQEAEEEELNQLYIDALKHGSADNVHEAIRMLEQLKQELERDVPRIKDSCLLNRLKYLTNKNLGLFRDDLGLILDALEIDDSDINLWIAAGRKSRQKLDYFLSKHCFQAAFSLNPLNLAAAENLIDLYFITDNLYRCASLCFTALEIDPAFLKAKIVLNECIRLLPPIVKDIDPELLRPLEEDEAEDHDESYALEILNELNRLKIRHFRCDVDGRVDQAGDKPKRKKFILNFNRREESTFEKIGLKLKKIYDSVQRNQNLSVCSPILVMFDQQPQQSCNNCDPANACDEPPKAPVKPADQPEQTKEQRQQERLLLYEYTDKRRSSRVKTKSRGCGSGSHHPDFDLDDHGSIMETLSNLLPERLKQQENNKNSTDQSVDSEFSGSGGGGSDSGSQNATSGDSNSISKSTDDEIVEHFYRKLEDYVTERTVTILDLIEFFLKELSHLVKTVVLPSQFMALYRVFREHYQLPCAIMCQIGQDITADHLMLCLTANEIQYNPGETLFLKQILSKLNNYHFPSFRHFLIRLFVLCGCKELNLDFLHYALDLCQPKPEYWKHFLLITELPEMAIPIEVYAANRLKINEPYIRELIDMQNVFTPKSYHDKDFSEIIKLFFNKSDQDLKPEDRLQLYEAIETLGLWQKGLELFENWSHLDQGCLETILRCVTANSSTQKPTARISSKLTRKIIKYAVEGTSVTPWMILYHSRLADETNGDPGAMVKFFALGHAILAKRGRCTDGRGEFLWRAQKVFVQNDVEQEALMCFSCLFDYPPRKTLFQEQHTGAQIALQWEHCRDIYEYFAPEEMPEFDSHARQSSITVETKDFFQKILQLIPETDKPKHTEAIIKYIKRGTGAADLISMPSAPEIHPITATIYYLLADYHFKARDFDKAKYFYINDLSLNVRRFDSWAGLALSINYRLDQLSTNESVTDSEEYHQTAFSAMQCFEIALRLQPDNCKLWIEYGILCYSVAANLSRLVKRYGQKPNETYYQYETVIDQARRCFQRSIDADIENDESWLAYYMLGKVAEKSKTDLLTTLRYYEWAALNLYLDGAAYPKKIPYYNPPNLAIEALEIHYRIHSCILKYLLNNRKFTARLLRNLKFYLIKAKKSPFVTRRQYWQPRTTKLPKASATGELLSEDDQQQINDVMSDMLALVAERQVKYDVNQARKELIEMCIQGIKKCLARYSAHYKSYFRLAHYHFFHHDFGTAQLIFTGGAQNKRNAALHFDPEDPEKATGAGRISYITGLFAERKPTNLYNGIWRIPIDEIERAGTFSFHMLRCTKLLVQVAEMNDDYYLLASVASMLYRKPDADKKYIDDVERTALSRESFEKCFDIFKRMSRDRNVNRNRLIEEIQSVSQTFVRNQVFAKETVAKANELNEQLLAAAASDQLLNLFMNYHPATGASAILPQQRE